MGKESRIFTSHGFNKLTFVLSKITLLGFLSITLSFLVKTFNIESKEGEYLLIMSLLICLCFLNRKIINPFFDTLAAFLYINIKLKTKVSFKEAAVFKKIFCVETWGRWYPLSHIRKLPKNQRKPALYIEAETIMDELGMAGLPLGTRSSVFN